MFHGFPYTNFHDLNLDWIIKTVKMLFNKSVFSINNVEPDEEGNVTITGAELGAVGTVNNIAPVNGNVTITASDVGAVAVGQGVTKVNGFSPNSAGEILAGTVRSINGISPASLPTPGNVVLNASDVGALPSTIDPVETVNGLTPDINGNVNVGTVKSVNNTIPDAQGNVNLPTVAGVTSVDGIGPDAQGNVQLTLTENVNFYIDAVNGSDTNDGSQNAPFATIGKAIGIAKQYSIATDKVFILRIATGDYPEVLDLRRIPNEVSINLTGDIKIAGILNYLSHVTINGPATLTIEANDNVTYPWGKHLIQVGNMTDMPFNPNVNVVFTSALSNYDAVYCIQNATLSIPGSVTFSGTLVRNITLNNAIMRCGPVTMTGTNIGRLEASSILYIDSINNSNVYTGTTLQTHSAIVFNLSFDYLSNVPKTFTVTFNDSVISSENRNYRATAIGGYLFLTFDLRTIDVCPYNTLLMSGLPAMPFTNSHFIAIGSGNGMVDARQAGTVTSNTSIPSGSHIVGCIIAPLASPT